MTDSGTDHFDRWREDEAAAEAMIPILGRLYRDHDVILYIYGRKLQRTPIEIIKTHRYARNFTERELRVQDTVPVLETLAEMPLDSAKINLGKLTNGWLESGESDLGAYLERELESVTNGHGRLLEEPTDVVLYGFGRIGRLLARILTDQEQRAHDIINKHRRGLELIAQSLLEHETIDGAEVARLIQHGMIESGQQADSIEDIIVE